MALMNYLQSNNRDPDTENGLGGGRRREWDVWRE